MLAADVALLLLLGAILVALYAVFHRLTNSRGTLSWEVRTTKPEPGNADVEEARRRVAEMNEARQLLDEREAELRRLEKKYGAQ